MSVPDKDFSGFEQTLYYMLFLLKQLTNKSLMSVCILELNLIYFREAKLFKHL